MAKLLTLLLFVPLSCLPVFAQKADPGPEVPGIESAIPESVKKLGKPATFPFNHGLSMAVSTSSDAAQIHTLQGLNHLHGGWEFEASRHFSAALREDPDCLLAHWGLVMCVLARTPETDLARTAASERLLVLIDQGKGTEIERGFAYGLVKYIEEGPQGAGIAFRRVADKFPNDLQAEIFAALFSRTGYDDLGQITPDQETAEKRLLALVEKYPDSALPLHALLSVRAEAPDLRDSLELARRLTQMVPDYAPYFHVLGHYEWRCGEHARAASSFGRAATLFSNWMRDNDATVADCPEWIRSEAYRIVALASKGDFDNAYAAAIKLSKTPTDPERAGAAGTRMILWEAQTLPARILLRRGLPGNAAEGLASLPAPAESEPFRETSLAHWWIDGLRICLEAQRLLDAKTLDKARETIDALSFHGEAMAKQQGAAIAGGERSAWTRSFRALEVLASELRGRLALAGPPAGHGSAFNWFRAATDRQKPATLLNPPLVLTPMAMRLGDYHLARNQPAEAIEAYQEGLVQFPNDMETMQRLQLAYERAKQPEKAAETEAAIKAAGQ